MRNLTQVSSGSSPKLGLALSGGGFRASFFHLGVLTRLAELDLLRQVDVISTVSGGSIIGALYYLHLKYRVESQGELRRQDYIELVDQVKEDLYRGVRANIRSRWLSSFLFQLKSIYFKTCSGYKMSQLYDRYIFESVLTKLESSSNQKKPKGIPIKDMAIQQSDPSSKVPQLVVNATSLNSGCPFRFSSSEILDVSLGGIRFEEVKQVQLFKALLYYFDKGLLKTKDWAGASRFALGEFNALLQKGKGMKNLVTRATSSEGGFLLGPYTQEHLLWWNWVEHQESQQRKAQFNLEVYRFKDEYWKGFPFEICCKSEILKAVILSNSSSLRFFYLRFDFVRALKVLSLQLLKEAYVLDSQTELPALEPIWNQLSEIDPEAEGLLRKEVGNDRKKVVQFGEFLVDLYYFRAARAFSWRVNESLDRLTLTDAVSASANFPPVFTPFKIRGLFDSDQVESLSLSDGGVYDNSGIDTLLDEGCTHLIVSDAGGLLRRQDMVSNQRFPMMTRISGVLMSNVRERQLKVVRSLRKANRKLEIMPRIIAGTADGNLAQTANELKKPIKIYPVKGLAYFDMESRATEAELDPSSPPGLPEHPEWRELTKIRTDLDSFADIEIIALMYQGYQLSDRFVRKHLSNTGLEEFHFHQKPNWPAELFNPKFELRRHGTIIRAGKLRVGRLSRMQPVLFYVFTLIPVMLIILGLMRSGMNFIDLGTRLGTLSYWLLEHPYLVPGLRIPMNTHLAFLLVVLGLPALFLFKKFLWNKIRGLIVQYSAKQLINQKNDPIYAFSLMKKVLDGLEFAMRVAFLSIWLLPFWIAGAISLLGKMLILEEKALLRIQNNQNLWLKHYKRKLSLEEQAEVYDRFASQNNIKETHYWQRRLNKKSISRSGNLSSRKSA